MSRRHREFTMEQSTPNQITAPICPACGAADPVDPVPINAMLHDGRRIEWDSVTCGRCGQHYSRKQIFDVEKVKP